MAVLMPMSSPRELRRGPPELPGLIAASVWIVSRIMYPSSVWRGRARPDTIPVVRVRSKPKGLPMASTFMPTRRFDEEPKGMVTSALPRGVNFTTARSFSGSMPTVLPSTSEPSARVMRIWSAPLTTW